jgi:hypothetical protein
MNEKETQEFIKEVENLSNQLMESAIKNSKFDALVAVGALVMAASRSAAMSGLKMSFVLNMFATQFENMVDCLHKVESTEETPDPTRN